MRDPASSVTGYFVLGLHVDDATTLPKASACRLLLDLLPCAPVLAPGRPSILMGLP
jgi:hypothetical protein